MPQARANKINKLESAKSSKITILSPGYRLAREQGCLVVRQGGKKIYQTPMIKASLILLSSRGVSLSTDVLASCARRNIPLLLLSPGGKVEAMVINPEEFRTHTVLAQLEFSLNPRKVVALAKAIVKGKVKNQLNLVKYFGKYRKQIDPAFWDLVREYHQEVKALLKEVKALPLNLSLDEARGRLFGVEGRAATRYWEMVKSMVEPRLQFQGRERKGAKDLFNSMLNYSYGVLYGLAYRAILAAQLIPQIGVLHSLAQDRQKTPLVYDLVEEFRPFVADRTVISLVNRGVKLQMENEGFLTLETRKILLRHLQARLATTVQHRGKGTTLEELMFFQARSLAQHFQGKGNYRPFIFKW